MNMNKSITIALVLVVILVGGIFTLILLPQDTRVHLKQINVTKNPETNVVEFNQMQLTSLQNKLPNERIVITEVIDKEITKVIDPAIDKLYDFEVKDFALSYKIDSDNISKKDIGNIMVVDKGVYSGYEIWECGLIPQNKTRTIYKDEVQKNQTIQVPDYDETYTVYKEGCRLMGERQELERIEIRPIMGWELNPKTALFEQNIDPQPTYYEKGTLYVQSDYAWLNASCGKRKNLTDYAVARTYDMTLPIQAPNGEQCYINLYGTTGTPQFYYNCSFDGVWFGNETARWNIDCENSSSYNNESVYSLNELAVYHFKFDAIDSTGNFDGTLEGGATVNDTGIVSTCLDLDGVNDYVQLPENIIDYQDNISLSMYVTGKSFDEAGSQMMYRFDNDAWFQGAYDENAFGANQLCVAFYDGSWSSQCITPSDNTGYLITLSYNTVSNNMSWWINGTYEGYATGGLNSNTDTTKGNRISDATNDWYGKMDEFYIYNTTLNLEQAQLIFNASTGTLFGFSAEETATTTTSTTSTTTTIVPGGWDNTNCTRYKCPVDTYVNKQFDCADNVLKYHCTLNLSNVTINATGVLGLNTTSGILGELKFI